MSRPYWNAEIETMSADDVARLQLERLKRQLAYVKESSPFYRRKFDEAGFDPGKVRRLEDLEQVGFTGKNELRDSQIAHPPLGEHLAARLPDVIRVHSSSGTTGRPSYVAITRADRDVWTESVSRVYYCEGARPEDVMIHGFGLGFFVGGLPLKDALENIGAAFVPIGVGASERLVTAIEHLGATQMTCTPSYAKYLAEWVRQKRGVDPRTLGLQRIMVGAEPGGGIPAVRARIAGDWGVQVTEGLGNADLVPVYAASCDANDGMHFLTPDFLRLEVIDPQSGAVLPMEDGVTGELVATHLAREAVPLVRFRTRDRVELAFSPCTCGRTGPRIRCVGRTDDLLIVAGVNVWPSAISEIVEGMRPATTGALQILLEAPPPKVEPPLRLQIEVSAGADGQAVAKRVAAAIRERLIVKAAVEVVSEGTLPRFEMKASYITKLYEKKETGTSETSSS